MKAYLIRHLQVLFATLGDLRRTPLVSINTILLIGLSLSLPALLYIAVKSGQQLNQNWQGQQQISVFLEAGISADEAKLIFEELGLHPQIQLAEFINPEQAMEEFKALSGLGIELEFLDENPLPASIVILPVEADQSSASLVALRDQLLKIDGIEDIRMDLEWTDRFNALLNWFERSAQLLCVILGLALTLVVANSIKLLIMNRRQEIEITKLVGGSNRFVRRPFLYFGAWYGFLGGLFAVIFLLIASQFMQSASEALARLYQKDSLVHQLSVLECATLVMISVFLGWLSARVSVAQHLNKIRPR